MTRVSRREAEIPKYRIVPIFDQEVGQHVYCVVDSEKKHWARGSDPAGYRDRQSAEEKLAQLRREDPS